MRLALALVVTLASGAAWAQRSVTVVGVRGDGGDAMASALEALLATRYQVVEGGVYRAAAEQMGMGGASTNEVAQVARRQRVDAVLAGALDPDGPGGARWLLRVVVRDGADGAVVARIKLQLRARSLDGASGASLMAQLAEAIDGGVVGVPHRRASASAPPAPVEEEERAPIAREERGSSEPQPAEAAVVAGPPVLPSTALTFGAGLGLLSRTLEVHGPGAPSYRGGAASAVRADVEVYPFAATAALRKSHRALACFGLVASWIEALPFRSVAVDGSLVGASARRFSFALAARVPTGSPTRPVITLRAGYGELWWRSDEPAHLGVPDVRYQHLELGLAVAVPLATPRVTLDLSVEGRVLLDAGAIAAPDQFGGGSGLGGDGTLGITVHATRFLWLRAAARYGANALTFSQSGARLGDSALDRFFDGAIEVGLAG